MPARTADQVNEFYAKAILAHDLNGALEFYDTDSVLVSDGQPVRGRDAIKEIIATQVAMQPTSGSIETVFCVEQEGLALTRSKWHFNGEDTDGNAFEVMGSGSEDMRRKTDGTWVYLIDNPRGGDPLNGNS